MRFLLSPVGRLSRKDWWLKAVPVLASAFLAASLLDTYLFGWNPLLGPARLVIGLLFLQPTIALVARRLHDLNRSFATLAPLVVALVAAPLIVAFGMDMTGELLNGFSGLGALVMMLALAGVAGLLVLLGTAPGNRGPNSHGPDPLAAVPLGPSLA